MKGHTLKEIFFEKKEEKISVEIIFQYFGKKDFLSFGFLVSKDGKIEEISETLKERAESCFKIFKNKIDPKDLNITEEEIFENMNSFIKNTNFWDIWNKNIDLCSSKILNISKDIILEEIQENVSLDILVEGKEEEDYFKFEFEYQNINYSIFLHSNKEIEEIEKDRIILDFEESGIEYYFEFSFCEKEESGKNLIKFKKDIFNDKRIKLKKLLKTM